MFISAEVFLGMHSKNEKVRITCKNFFVERMHEKIFITFEEVGKCDHVIWSLPRKIQSAYYPFMDELHSRPIMQRCDHVDGELCTLEWILRNIDQTKEKKFPSALEKLYQKSLKCRLAKNKKGILK